jgi:uncharacterized protein (DUF433 family)
VVSCARLLWFLAADETGARILAAYPCLKPEDVNESLQYAALLAKNDTVKLAG